MSNLSDWSAPEKCTACDGAGVVRAYQNGRTGSRVCPCCDGSGNETPEQRLSRLMDAEEEQRRQAALNQKFECVPWRGTGGEIGKCIYCGK